MCVCACEQQHMRARSTFRTCTLHKQGRCDRGCACVCGCRGRAKGLPKTATNYTVSPQSLQATERARKHRKWPECTHSAAALHRNSLRHSIRWTESHRQVWCGPHKWQRCAHRLHSMLGRGGWLRLGDDDVVDSLIERLLERLRELTCGMIDSDRSTTSTHSTRAINEVHATRSSTPVPRVACFIGLGIFSAPSLNLASNFATSAAAPCGFSKRPGSDRLVCLFGSYPMPCHLPLFLMPTP